MATKKYISLDKLGLYDEKIKKVISDGDAATLAAAKKHAEDLGVNYDAAGAAATVQGKLDDEITRAKAAEEANAAAAKKAQDEVDALELVVDGKADQTALDTLAGKVGNVPEGQNVMGIITKIQSDAYNDTELRNLITALDTNKADKTQVATDIADAVKAEEDARKEAVKGVQDAVDALAGTHGTDKKALEDAIALKADQTALDEVVEDVADIAKDYLKAADKTELEGKIDAKADKTALDAVSAVANAAVAKADYDVKVKALEDEDVRIAGLVTAEAQRAAGVESGLRTDVDAIKGDYLKATDKTELSNAITAEKERAEAAEESLQTQINTIMNNPDAEGAINSINEFTQYVAEHGEIAEAFRTDINANAKAIEDHVALAAETYETKEDATTKYDELMAHVDSKAVQADWNQNDETAADYIKNRPFYESVAETVWADLIVTDTESGKLDRQLQRLVYENDVFVVTVGDVEHRCTIKNVDGVLTAVWDGDAVDCFYITSNNKTRGEYPTVTSDTRFKIVKIEGSSVKQLDEKYIPDTIARVADLEDAAGRVEVLEGKVEALEGKMTTAEGAIDAVEARLDAVEPKVETLEGKMEAVEGAVATKAEAQDLTDAVADLEQAIEDAVSVKADAQDLTDAVAALEQADATLAGKIEALEGKVGTGEGTVEDLVADVKAEVLEEMATAIEDAKSDAADKDVVVLAEAQKGINAVQTALDTHTGNADIHVTAADKAKWNAAEAKAHEHGNLTVLESITADKVTAWDKVTGKAEQTALQAEIDRATAKEAELAAAIAAFVEASEEDINGLFA